MTRHDHGDSQTSLHKSVYFFFAWACLVQKNMAANLNTTAVPDSLKKNVKDCPVDPNGDLDDPNNLFTCDTDQTCCTVDLNPACCSKKDINDEMWVS